METDSINTLQSPFVQGPIHPSMIAAQIDRTGRSEEVGGYDIFLGKVRADEHEGMIVEAIEYSTYDKMAAECIERIQDNIITQYPVKKVFILHSKGIVQVGEISLFVLVTAQHRTQIFEAVKTTVEKIKAEVPIWKKELFREGQYRWIS